MGKGCKVVVCGQAAVGKTAIVEQLLYGNHSVGSESRETLEDVYVASVETDRGVREQLRLYDTRGLHDGQDLPKHYYSVADGFVLVYSVDSLDSFKRVDVLKKEIDKSRDKKEGKQFTSTVYSDGALLTSTRDNMGRWAEYVEDLLNPTSTSSKKEAEPGNPGSDSPISGTDVTEEVKKLLGDKAPGVEEIHLEFLKALNVITVIVLGNKSDLQERRQVDQEVAQQWARGEKVKLWEVSVAERSSLIEPFTQLTSRLTQPQSKSSFPLPGRKSKGTTSNDM